MKRNSSVFAAVGALFLSGCFAPEYPSAEAALSQAQSLLAANSPSSKFAITSVKAIECKQMGDGDFHYCSVRMSVAHPDRTAQLEVVEKIEVDEDSGQLVRPVLPFAFELRKALDDYFAKDGEAAKKLSSAGATYSSWTVSMRDGFLDVNALSDREFAGTISLNLKEGKLSHSAKVFGVFKFSNGDYEFSPFPIKEVIGKWSSKTTEGENWAIEFKEKGSPSDGEIWLSPEELISTSRGGVTESYFFEYNGLVLQESGVARFNLKRNWLRCEGRDCLSVGAEQSRCTMTLVQPVALKLSGCLPDFMNRVFFLSDKF